MTPIEAAARAVCKVRGQDPDRVWTVNDDAIEVAMSPAWMQESNLGAARAAVTAFLEAVSEDEIGDAILDCEDMDTNSVHRARAAIAALKELAK